MQISGSPIPGAIWGQHCHHALLVTVVSFNFSASKQLQKWKLLIFSFSFGQKMLGYAASQTNGVLFQGVSSVADCEK